ncbi:MAG: IS1 family transposase [Nitrospiraceae bacterium]|nr:IS1 family transposase [Nitrospiraceae bacterium]
MADVSINTVTKLLADAGNACSEYQDKAFHNLQCKRVRVNEIWAFCYSKEKNIPEERKGGGGHGDIWTYTAICADSKLVPSWLVGCRAAEAAYEFMKDLAGRMAPRIQLTTDASHAHLNAIDDALGSDIDYGQIVKMYHSLDSVRKESIYNSLKCIKAKKYQVAGSPDRKHISTPYVERQNQNMRMRRFTWLTNAFSKKVENYCHALALYFMFYNFVQIHSSLRVTPAMTAGITDHVWDFEKILALLK